MKPSALTLWFGWLLTLSSPPTLADQLMGRVVNVIDGDTITMTDTHQTTHHIRIEAIDAPERGQPHGQVSRRHLNDLVAGQHIQVEFKKRDRYGRLVGRVILQQQDIGLRQIEAGLAWHYKAYAAEQKAQDRERYARAEARARTERRGLWIEPDPTPPWVYRRLPNNRPITPAGMASLTASGAPLP